MLECARKPGIVGSYQGRNSAGSGGVHRFKAGPLLVLDIDGGGHDVEMLDPGLHVAAMVTPYASDAVVTGDQLAGQLLECGVQVCDRTALDLADTARDRRLGVAARSGDAAHLVQPVLLGGEVAGEDVYYLG